MFGPDATAASEQRWVEKVLCKMNDVFLCPCEPRVQVCFCSVSKDANAMHDYSPVFFQKLKLSCCQIKSINQLDHCNH